MHKYHMVKTVMKMGIVSLKPSDWKWRNCKTYCLSGDEIDEKQLEEWKIDADAGSEQAELLLGQHYLNRAQFDEDAQPNAKLGVSFLVKSSKQGNEDATKLLTDCLNKELGQYIYITFCYFCQRSWGGYGIGPVRLSISKISAQLTSQFY